MDDEERLHCALEQIECLHFNLLHIEEAGFRTSAAEEKVDGDAVEEEVEADTASEIVMDRVRALKAQFDSERLSGGTNGKEAVPS